MKKLCSKTLKTLIENTNAVHKRANFSEKSYRVYTTIGKAGKFHVLHNKV